jgi:hypothetical protein
MQESSQGKQKEPLYQVTHDQSMEIKSGVNTHEVGNSTVVTHDGFQEAGYVQSELNIKTDTDMSEGSATMVSSTIQEDVAQENKLLLNVTAEIISIVTEGGISGQNTEAEADKEDT